MFYSKIKLRFHCVSNNCINRARILYTKLCFILIKKKGMTNLFSTLSVQLKRCYTPQVKNELCTDNYKKQNLVIHLTEWRHRPEKEKTTKRILFLVLSEYFWGLFLSIIIIMKKPTWKKHTISWSGSHLQTEMICNFVSLIISTV